MIKIRTETGALLTLKMVRFPGGEIHPTISNEFGYSFHELTFEAHLYKPEDIFELLLVHDSARRMFPSLPFKLLCPYLPYARQDRVANTGEALSVKVMCDLINWMHFESVEVWDVHSDVSLALLERVVNITPKGWLSRANIDWKNTILVAPDAGAQKKVRELAKVFDCGLVTAIKCRDTKTGEITHTEVTMDQKKTDKNFLIVDDICDGGRTFIELARLLSPITTGKLNLYITHGIFSNGFNELSKWFNTIYSPHIWSNESHRQISRQLLRTLT